MSGRKVDPLGVDAAIRRLAAQEKCSSHEYGKPTSWESGPSKHRETWWQAKCRRCGRSVSRHTVEELRAVLAAEAVES